MYDGIEILLFTVRGNLKSFFTAGVPDDVIILFIFSFDFPSTVHYSLYVSSWKSTTAEWSSIDGSNIEYMCLFDFVISVSLNIIVWLFSQVVPVISATLISLMIAHDHICDLTATLCSILYTRCQRNTDLMNDLIVEISKQNFSETAKTSSLIKNLSHFIVELMFWVYL